jgi:hypothetical protein
MKVRKKAVVVDAHEFKVPQDEAVPEWYQEAVLDGRLEPFQDEDSNYLFIRTLEDGPNNEAEHVGDEGDFVIRGVKGELYACKPDIFWMTYELPEEEGFWTKADLWLGRIAPWVFVVGLTVATLTLVIASLRMVF